MKKISCQPYLWMLVLILLGACRKMDNTAVNKGTTSTNSAMSSPDIFVPRPLIVTTFAGNGIQGFADGPALQAEFNFPVDIVMDAAGNLYECDLADRRIRKITPDGIVSTLAGTDSGRRSA